MLILIVENDPMLTLCYSPPEKGIYRAQLATLNYAAGAGKADRFISSTMVM